MVELCLHSSLFIAASPSNACFAPPLPLTVHHKELVSEAKSIVLARVVGTADKATPILSSSSGLLGQHDKPLPKFETIEVLRGDVPVEFALSGAHLTNGKYNKDGDFNNHRDLVFWDKGITGNWNGPDCRMYPGVISERTYLIFLDRPHWRAYEEIRAPDDLWLSAVRHLIDDPSSSGLSFGVYEWLSQMHGVFIGKIISCAGPTISVDEILLGKFGSTWQYSNNSDAGYWPAGKCVLGQKLLVTAYREKPDILPYYSASVFPVSDGLVNLSESIRRSEIEITGSAVQSLENLRKQFSQPK